MRTHTAELGPRNGTRTLPCPPGQRGEKSESLPGPEEAGGDASSAGHRGPVAPLRERGMGPGRGGSGQPVNPQVPGALAPPGGWVRSASWPMQYFCRVEGPSLLGLDSSFLDVHLSDKTSQRDPGGQCGWAAPRAP